jgi:hypothetical protein
MGRFTAWMASRRKTLRRQGEGARRGRATRALGIERCEQRIALSTNAIYEPAHLTFAGFRENEGGFIVLTNGAGYTVSTSPAGIVPAFSPADATPHPWHWLNASDTAFLSNAGATRAASADRLNLSYSPRLLGTTIKIQPDSGWDGSFNFHGDFDMAPPGVLITESSVVPIPPPTAEPGRNEGGQISMIPFIGPSMFGLQGANESQLAVRTRQALGAEPLEPAPAADSGRADSLRGRAVVYEVAHARPLTTTSAELVSKEAVVQPRGGDDFEGFERSEGHRDAARSEHAARVASFSADVSKTTKYSRNADLPGERAATEALFVRGPLEGQREVADGEAVEEPTEARVASARDAAFAQLEQELEPLEQQRDAAAATADAHQRRILGGALIAVAAVPVLKSIHRKGQQQAVEARPRRTFHAG